MFASNPSQLSSARPPLPVGWYAAVIVLTLLLGASCFALVEVLQGGDRLSLRWRLAESIALTALLAACLACLFGWRARARRQGEEQQQTAAASAARTSERCDQIGKTASDVIPAVLAPSDVDLESLRQLENQILLLSGYSEVALSNLQPADPMRADIEQLARAGARSALLCREAMTMPSHVSRRPVNLNPFFENFERRLRSMADGTTEVTRRIDALAGTVETDPELLEQSLLSLALGAMTSVREPVLVRLSCSLGRIEMAIHTRGAVNLGWAPDPEIRPNRAAHWLKLLGTTVEQETAERGGHRFRIYLDGGGAGSGLSHSATLAASPTAAATVAAASTGSAQSA